MTYAYCEVCKTGHLTGAVCPKSIEKQEQLTSPKSPKLPSADAESSEHSDDIPIMRTRQHAANVLPAKYSAAAREDAVQAPVDGRHKRPRRENVETGVKKAAGGGANL